MANSIDIAQDAVNKSIKNIESSIDKIAKSLQANNEAIILASQKAVDKENESKKKTADTIIEKNEDSAEKINADQLSNAQKISQTISSGVGKAFNDITSKFKSMLEQYTNEQQKLAFNLLGTGFSYMDMRNALSVLSTNTILKQNDVYKNLTDLVSNGINLNAAQRAFLKTASDQVNLGFQANEAALNRLIQLQRTDLSEARVAQMAGLRKFLEQNYQNSQYIRQGFADVSAALFEMQSLMSSQLAMSVEQSIQTYLGSFAAAGGNTGTATNIAQAIGKIGSGDFSDLGNMQNLMVMAASRANLSYADILNNGISESDSKKLMNAMMGYIGSIGNVGGGSNAAMNAMAKLFGVSVSDIKAAQNMNLSAANTGYTSSINQFLYDLASSTNESTQIANWWANGISNQALTTPLGLVGYDLLEGLSTMVGGIIQNTETDTFLGNLLGTNTAKSAGKNIAAALISNAPALGILGSVLFSGDAEGDNYFKNLFSAEGIGQIASGGLENAIQTLLTGKGSGSAYEELMNAYGLIGGFNNEKTFRTSGSFSAGPGVGTSGSITNSAAPGGIGGLGSVNTVDIVSSYATEDNSKTLDDLYELLSEDFVGTEWMSVPRIAANPGVGAENSIWLGSAELTSEIAKAIGETSISNQLILELLEKQFGYLQESLTEIAKNNSFSFGDIFGVPGA